MGRKNSVWILLCVFLLCFGGYCRASDLSSKPPITIGIIHFSKPLSIDMDFEPTLKYLEKYFAPRKIIFKEYSSPDLEKAVKDGSIDFFYASSGFFWRMLPFGVKNIATVVTNEKPEPNTGTAGAYIALKSRDDLQKVEDLEGKRIGANYPSAFHGFRINMADIAERGYNPETFFGEVHFVGEDARQLLNVLLDKRVDAVILRACWIEEFEMNNMPVMKTLKIIGSRSGPIKCLHSTRAYPNNTLGSTFTVSPELAREMTVALLTMPPTANGQKWSVSTDFKPVDQLYLSLKEGPYEYLRHWNWKKVLKDYWGVFAILLLAILGLYLHGKRSDALVEKRTRELLASQKEKEALEKRALDLSEQMESHQKMNLIGQLSSMFAHEINQPLSACTYFLEGFKELLKSNGSIDKETLEFGLSEMEKELGLAGDIVQKVRGYAKRTGGREDKVDFSAITEEVVEALRLKFADKCRIAAKVEPGIFVKGDLLEIRLLVWNLVKNALEASVDSLNPEVVIKASKNGEAALTVSNTGKVLSEEEFQEMGRKVFRSQKQNGLGIGLSVVASIIEASKGKIQRTRRAEGGLSVKATLPLWEEGEGNGEL